MSDLKGLPDTAVTATAQRVILPTARTAYTIRNTDAANALYYKYDTDEYYTSLIGENETAMRALLAGKLNAGESIVIGPDISFLDVACVTGQTATLRIEPGINGRIGDAAAAIAPKAAAINPGSAKSISNTSAEIAAANTARKSLTVTNLSLTAMLTVKLAATAVSGAGYCLATASDATHPGGSVTITDYCGVVHGIMSAADATAGNVAVVEV